MLLLQVCLKILDGKGGFGVELHVLQDAEGLLQFFGGEGGCRVVVVEEPVCDDVAFAGVLAAADVVADALGDFCGDGDVKDFGGNGGPPAVGEWLGLSIGG